MLNATLRELSAALAAKKLSSVELTRACLGRIERHNGELNAFITADAPQALAAAERADARRAGKGNAGEAGPLTGIPVAHKDIYLTRGIRTTGGSALLADWLPDDDATCVRRWQEAGTVLLGKLITHEFAFGMQFPGHLRCETTPRLDGPPRGPLLSARLRHRGCGRGGGSWSDRWS